MKSDALTIRLALTAIPLIAALACTRPSTIPVPETSPATLPAESSSPMVAEKNLPNSWQLSPTTDTQRYSTTVTANIEQTPGIRDTITTRARYNLSMTRLPTSVSLTGSIEAFTVQAGNRIGANVLVTSFPVSFTGIIQAHELRLDISNSLPSTSPLCDVPARSALTTVERNLFITPLQLSTGLTWQDSLSTTSCSGQLPLSLTILRTYKITGPESFNGVPAIGVDMTEKTLSTGEGSQDQHRIIINAEGLKSGRLYLDPLNGSLISLSSETHTTLQIQSSGKTQQFVQNSRETTTRM